LSPEAYDGYVEDYISEIAMDQFPQNKPLWEVHIIQYPTTNAAGNLIFKFHHSLGDGYTLMGGKIIRYFGSTLNAYSLLSQKW
jgi:hypothetical protein